MPDGNSDLGGELERKVPHLTFMMHVFADDTLIGTWSYDRLKRFRRFKEIVRTCWENMQSMARQMVWNRAFYRMYRSLERSMAKIRVVEELIFRAFSPTTSSSPFKM